ncbi:MAG: hypothetical protein WBL93_12150 [Lutisporaceae bacterium]
MKKVMKWVFVIIILVALAFSIFLVITQKGKDLLNKDAFIQELNVRGYKLQEVKMIAEDNRDFGVSRQYILTDRATFNVYEFSSPDVAKLAASNISASGSSIKTSNMVMYISWSDHPHYYCSGNLIVLYCGRDSKVLFNMRSIMGKQTAGAKWYEIIFSRGGR